MEHRAKHGRCTAACKGHPAQGRPQSGPRAKTIVKMRTQAYYFHRTQCTLLMEADGETTATCGRRLEEVSLWLIRRVKRAYAFLAAAS